MKRFNFSYDKENDDLFLSRPESRSKGSVEIGDIIIDYNAKKEIVGIELMNASMLIKDMISVDDSRIINEILGNLSECKVDIKTKNNLSIIRLCLQSDSNEITPIISVPSITEKSPALICG